MPCGELSGGTSLVAMAAPEGSRDRPADLGSYVANLSNAVHKGISRLVAPYGLTYADLHLMMICQENGECTVSQLARMLPVDATRISRLATDLVDRGLLSRRRLRHDRRVVMLGLTPAGQELTAQATEELQHYYAKLTAGITPKEFQVFAATALRITANFEEM